MIATFGVENLQTYVTLVFVVLFRATLRIFCHGAGKVAEDWQQALEVLEQLEGRPGMICTQDIPSGLW